MDYLTLVLLSLSLAMDAFTVSICDGLSMTNLTKKKAIFIPFMFGLFQALFPLAGYYLGVAFLDYIKDYDHWIDFALLLIIGGKMIIDSIKGLRNNDPSSLKEKKQFSYLSVTIQAVAVSIDALAVGITLLTSPLNIYINIAFIGVITFLVCIPGVYLGQKIVNLLKGKTDIASLIGGVILVLLGLKILLNHLGYLSF